MNATSYDQWKTASPYDDEEPAQTINAKLCDGTILIGYGKPGHGMNGKDADLDRGGQCLLKSLVTQDPVGAKKMRVQINLHLYANVCEPYVEQNDGESDEDYDARRSSAMDVATEIVSDEQRYDGEWTGSDYWSFRTDVTLYVPLSLDEYEWIEAGREKTLARIAARISRAICKGSKEIKEFETAMAALSDAIDKID